MRWLINVRRSLFSFVILWSVMFCLVSFSHHCSDHLFSENFDQLGAIEIELNRLSSGEHDSNEMPKKTNNSHCIRHCHGAHSTILSSSPDFVVFLREDFYVEFEYRFFHEPYLEGLLRPPILPDLWKLLS